MIKFETISFLSEARTHIAFLTELGGCIDFAEFAAARLFTFHRPMCNLVSTDIILGSGGGGVALSDGWPLCAC